MTGLSLVRKTLRDNRGAIIGVSVANVLIALFVTLAYPSFQAALADYEFPDFLRGFLGEAGVASYGTFTGFITVELFSWLPMLLIVLAIIGGTATLAGEEGAGTLDLVLAQPVKRVRVVLEKAAGLAIGLAVSALVTLLGFVVAPLLVDFSIPFRPITVAVLNTLPLALLFLGLSMLAASILPSRGSAAMLVIGLTVATYFFNLIGGAVESVAFLQKVSPFYWADASHVLLHGFDWARTGGFLLLTVACLLMTLWSFERRDIAVGARAWRVRLPRLRPGGGVRRRQAA